jgi:hypothetical protein
MRGSRAGLRGRIGALQDGDDVRTGAGREQQLGGVRREAHDAPRRRRERDRAAGVVDGLHRGRRGIPRGRDDERRRDQRRDHPRARHSCQRTPPNTRAPPVE